MGMRWVFCVKHENLKSVDFVAIYCKLRNILLYLQINDLKKWINYLKTLLCS